MSNSDKPRKKKAAKKSKNKPHKAQLGKELNDLHQSCRNMLSDGGEILKLVFNKDLVAAGDSEKIHDATTVLSNDIITMRTRLDEIRAKQPVNINPEKDLMICLECGSEYSQWIETYQQTIVPNIKVLHDLYLEAKGSADHKVSEVDPAEVSADVE